MRDKKRASEYNRAYYLKRRDEIKKQVRDYRRSPRGKSVKAKHQLNYRAGQSQKYKAVTAVGNAIRLGKLTRQPCEKCGSTTRVEAHHDDYSKPLDVRWLCHIHHGEHHAARKTHPDAGGNPDDFKRLQDVMEVLSK